MSLEAFIQAAQTAEDHFYGIGALGAVGRLDALRRLFECYLASGLAFRPLYETVLQLYLFAGYPRAINALGELHAVSGRQYPAYVPPDDLDDWQADGEALCARIYGSNYEKLIARMTQLSPELARWMVLEGYGKVLSRPALPAASRECSVIGALTALGVERQLTSHLRGSLNLGVSADHIRRGLNLLAHLLPSKNIARAHALLDRSDPQSR